MAFDFRAIRRLPPDERIAALEQLEDELRKLIEKRRKEIDQSQREIAEAEEIFERARDELVVLQQVATPEFKKVKIDDLFFKKPEKPKMELEDTVEETVLNRRLQDEYMRPAVLEAVKSLYENKPANTLTDEMANIYTNPQRALEVAQEEYIMRKTKKSDEEQNIVSEGVYKR